MSKMSVLNIWNCDNQIDALAKSAILCVALSFFIYLLIFNAFEIYVSVLEQVIIFLASFMFINSIMRMKYSQRSVESRNKAVLITGCDRGFGFLIAKRLSEVGFQVFAGCLNPFENGGQELNSNSNIHCLKLDVTKSQDIELALDYVSKHLSENGLWALINNSGISKGTDIELTSMAKIQEVVEVNLLGTIHVTKTFLPLLRKSKGRVINVASAAGRFMMPGFLAYSISKQAVIAFSEGLRLEMRKFGVSVVSIEPWAYRTKLSDVSNISSEIDKARSENVPTSTADAAYGIFHIISQKKNISNLFNMTTNPNVNEVIDVMEAAVTCECPAYFYRPGSWYLNVFLWILNTLPKSLADFLLCHFVFKR